MLATVFVLNICLSQLIDGIEYGDTRNSGVLGSWVIGLGGAPWIICNVAVAVLRGMRARSD